MPSPPGNNSLFVAIAIDYQRTTPYNDLHLPPGNGEVKREQSQIHLSSAEQASHLKTEFYNGEVSESNDKLLGLAKC